jgi:hypothetical protein
MMVSGAGDPLDEQAHIVSLGVDAMPEKKGVRGGVQVGVA